MIEINNIKKSFGDNILFNNLSLNIADNELVAIVGSSGCGKSTLLNIIGAIEPFDSGEILVDGIDISKEKNKLIYFREKVGFLFQNFALIENKLVSQNMNLIQKNFRSNITIEECLDKVNLTDKINAKVCTLSGGQQQRVSLARLMLKKCDLILADEPTGSLDEENGNLVFDILKKMKSEQNKTVVIVTHDTRLANKCERIINLNTLSSNTL